MSRPAQICLAGPHKCDGTWTCLQGILEQHGPAIAAQSMPDVEACMLWCALTAFCVRLTFGPSTTCALFRQGIYRRTNSGQVCVWNCCQDACSKGGPRCPGHWQLFQRARLIGGRVYSRIPCAVGSPIAALETCRMQPICGGLTFTSDQHCHLITYEATLIPKYDNSSEAYVWKCCEHNDADLDPHCRNAVGKCLGRWRTTDVQPRNVTRLVSMFHSLTKFDCLQACEANPYCNETYFNQTAAICLLKSNVSREDQVHFCDHTFFNGTENYQWFGYLWECCGERKAAPEKEEPLPGEQDYSQCLCLHVNESFVQVAADDCGRPDQDPHMRFIVKSDLAAFWSDASSPVVIFETAKWTRAHNGEFPVWLRLGASRASFCPAYHCRIFSPRINPLDFSCPEIVRREAWFPRPPARTLAKLAPSPVYAVVIGAGCPVFGCFTKASCSSTMRIFQTYQMDERNWPDIGYNYVVGSDGCIYEGVGPHYQSHHPNGYMSQSMVLGFVGRFQIRAPTMGSMRAARQLLKCLQHRGEINPRYALFPNSYFVPSYDWPGKVLKELLANWNHYQGVIFSRRTCPMDLPHLLLRYAVGPAAFALCLIASLVYVYVTVWCHSRWCPARKKNTSRLSQVILSEASGSELLLRNLQLLPVGCRLRNARTLHLQPACTELVMVVQNGAECECFRLLQLIWLRCCTASDPQFPARVANSLALRPCGAHTVLVLTRRLYVLHLRDRRALLRLLPAMAAARCVCKGNLRGELLRQPDLAAVSAKVAEWKVAVSCAGRANIKSLQRFFHSFGGCTVEIDFEQFRENLRLAENPIWGEEEPLIEIA